MPAGATARRKRVSGKPKETPEQRRLRRLIEIAPTVSARAARSYAREKAYERKREEMRQLTADYEDYVNDRDTPGARRVKRELKRIADAKRVVAVESDFPNLTGHTKLSPKEQRLQEKERRAALGIKKEIVHAHDGSIPEVDSKGFSIRGLEQQHQDAARRFAADFESAYRGLRCRGFDPGVDGGGAHGEHLVRISAQERMAALEKKVGSGNLVVLTAFVIYNASTADFRKHGGPRREVTRFQIEEILGSVAAFYGDFEPSGRLSKAAEEYIAHAERQAERARASSSGRASSARRRLGA